ncbi:plasmolipin [Aplochiton taeniatus]
MSEFPAKVSTETSGAQSQHSQGNNWQSLTASVSSVVDLGFLRTIPAILMIVQIVLGLLQWALIASAPYQLLPAYGWVMFVAVTLWLLTMILFFMLLCGVHRRLSSVPWSLVVMAYYAAGTVLYLTAFLANAASVHPYRLSYYYGHVGAAAFFGAVTTLAYGASAFFAYLAWRGDGENAAASTVPA